MGDEVYKRLWPEALWPGDMPAPLAAVVHRPVHGRDRRATAPAPRPSPTCCPRRWSWCGRATWATTSPSTATSSSCRRTSAAPTRTPGRPSRPGSSSRACSARRTGSTSGSARWGPRPWACSPPGTPTSTAPTSTSTPPGSCRRSSRPRRRSGQLQRQQLHHRSPGGDRGQRLRRALVLRRRPGQRQPGRAARPAAVERRQLLRHGPGWRPGRPLHPARLQDRRHAVRPEPPGAERRAHHGRRVLARRQPDPVSVRLPGAADIEEVALDGVSTVTEDDFWRLGVGVQRQIGDLAVSAAYLVGKDDGPYAPFSRRVGGLGHLARGGPLLRLPLADPVRPLRGARPRSAGGRPRARSGSRTPSGSSPAPRR